MPLPSLLKKSAQSNDEDRVKLQDYGSMQDSLSLDGAGAENGALCGDRPEGLSDGSEPTSDTEEGPAFTRMKRTMSSTVFFNDKSKAIDFVLAFQPSHGPGSKGTLFGQYRVQYEKRLKDQGLKLEYEGIDQSQDGKTCFVKIHAPWDVLTRTAEINRVKMPIRVDDLGEEPKSNIIENLFGKNPFRLSEAVKRPEVQYFTAAFSRDRISQFLVTDKSTFFTPTQRIRMVWDLLLRTNINISPGQGDGSAETIGLRGLLNQNVYVAAYPVHDGDYRSSKKTADRPPQEQPLRQWLFEKWAQPSQWYKYQPLNQIRNYYGEKVGIYFAWLGFYTRMLILPAIVGTLCFIFGVGFATSDKARQDVCYTANVSNLTVCRLCPRRVCPFKPLSASCLYATLTGIFDNYGTVIFALFVSVWAVVFLELWKRRQAELSWDWDVRDLEFVEETVRPEYQAAVKTKRVNPVTQEVEPYLPKQSRVQRMLTSGATVAFMLFVVLGILAGIIFYRIVGSGLYYQLKDPVVEKISAPIVTSITAAGINAVCILILGKLYERLAWLLTSNEFPRTENEFENSYTYKVFIFEFINYYAALFYIAFIKGKIFGPPNSRGYVDRCDPVGCLIDVCIQLAIIMIVKQIINNMVEIGWPVLSNWWKRRHNVKETEDNKYTRWEKDFDLSPMPQLGLFDEYLEMIIQYGFVTMFVAAFPLAPLFALLNNVIEIRLDAYKLTTQFRRPVPARARDIGAWFPVLEIITKIAVITNGLVIAFTSDFIDRMVYAVEYSPNHSMDGYIQHVFSKFSTKAWADSLLRNDTPEHSVTECWYRDYRYGPDAGARAYERTRTWWHVLVARLFFVIAFEHVVFLIQGVIQYLIPDVPDHVQVKIQRENYLAKQALYKHEFGTATHKDSTANGDAPFQRKPAKMVHRQTVSNLLDPKMDKKGKGDVLL